MPHNEAVPDSSSSDAAIDAAARCLYRTPPDEFMSARARLADQARKDGNSAAAAKIGALRKPTTAAWIVNLLAAENEAAADRLVELGEQLRAAQDGLDSARLRELSGQRRRLVAELARDAFARAGRRDPAAGLRDEVMETLDAAIADPDVAQRLGVLQRAEKWSGFGFAPTGSPGLTLVRGGRGAPAPTPARSAPPKPSAAERRKQLRALAAARDAFTAADTAHDDAQAAELGLSQRVRRLTSRLADLQHELDEAREELEAARADVASARTRRRQARSALDRAEREAPG
jgi:hypothetical protein